MGCGPSKKEDAEDEAGAAAPPSEPAAAKPSDVKVTEKEEPAKNAAGRRVSKTVRRIAVRYAALPAPHRRALPLTTRHARQGGDSGRHD